MNLVTFQLRDCGVQRTKKERVTESTVVTDIRALVWSVRLQRGFPLPVTSDHPGVGDRLQKAIDALLAT